MKTLLEQLDTWARIAIIHTPGAKIVSDGIELDISRYQQYEQFGMPSLRTGVFYLPELKSPFRGYYSTGKLGYGGGELITGRTKIKRPIIVKAGTGGVGIKKAYDIVCGKGTYDKMRGDVLNVIMNKAWTGGVNTTDIAEILRKYGGDENLAYDIFTHSKKGNTLAYAIQEHIAAVKIRNAGYDSVLSYSKSAGKLRLSELFDLRQKNYPSESGKMFLEKYINNQVGQSISPEQLLNPKTSIAVFRERIKTVPESILSYLKDKAMQMRREKGIFTDAIIGDPKTDFIFAEVSRESTRRQILGGIAKGMRPPITKAQLDKELEEHLKYWYPGYKEPIIQVGKSITKRKTVYHGTPMGGFKRFSMQMRGKNTGMKAEDTGFHFTNSYKEAESYSGLYKDRLAKEALKKLGYIPATLKRNPRAEIIEVHLDYKKPFYIGSSKNINSRTIAEAKRRGYDAIIADLGGNAIEYVVFSPEQIKIKNRIRQAVNNQIGGKVKNKKRYIYEYKQNGYYIFDNAHLNQYNFPTVVHNIGPLTFSEAVKLSKKMNGAESGKYTLRAAVGRYVTRTDNEQRLKNLVEDKRDELFALFNTKPKKKLKHLTKKKYDELMKKAIEKDKKEIWGIGRQVSKDTLEGRYGTIMGPAMKRLIQDPVKNYWQIKYIKDFMSFPKGIDKPHNRLVAENVDYIRQHIKTMPKLQFYKLYYPLLDSWDADNIHHEVMKIISIHPHLDYYKVDYEQYVKYMEERRQGLLKQLKEEGKLRWVGKRVGKSINRNPGVGISYKGMQSPRQFTRSKTSANRKATEDILAREQEIDAREKIKLEKLRTKTTSELIREQKEDIKFARKRGYSFPSEVRLIDKILFERQHSTSPFLSVSGFAKGTSKGLKTIKIIKTVLKNKKVRVKVFLDNRLILSKELPNDIQAIRFLYNYQKGIKNKQNYRIKEIADYRNA
ncbi:MAG: hypothetical protein PHX21_12975 [bacterium]|nr:hypothetical protein [bacterium]